MDGTLLETLSSVLGKLLSLKTDDYKKKVVSALSVGFSRVLSSFLLVMLLMIVLAVLAFGFIILLGDAIGSLSGAAFIVGGVFLIVLVVSFFLRKRLFLNMFTNLFNGIAEKDPGADEFRSVALLIVRYLRGRIDV